MGRAIFAVGLAILTWEVNVGSRPVASQIAAYAILYRTRYRRLAASDVAFEESALSMAEVEAEVFRAAESANFRIENSSPGTGFGTLDFPIVDVVWDHSLILGACSASTSEIRTAV